MEKSKKLPEYAEKRLETLLLEGISSGAPEPMTDEDWDRIRVEGQRRAGIAPQEAKRLE